MENAKILIVEDNAIVAESLKDRLVKLGYSVTGIENNKNEAIKNTEANKPNLVLMDIMLYGKNSGIEIADYIRAKFNVPVVFLTALSDKATLQKAKLSQPYGYIIKPFEEHSLESTIQIALYKHNIEKRLIESEEQFRQLSENIQLGFWLINIQKPVQVLYVNPAFERMWGIKPGVLYNNFKHFYKSLHSEDIDKVIHAFASFITSKGETNCEIEHRIIDKNGKTHWIWTRMFGIKNYKGEVYRAAGLAQDISEQKLQSLKLEQLVNIRTTELIQSNEKLKTENVEREKAEQKFKGLIELAPDPIITLNLNGIITTINRAALDATKLVLDNNYIGKHYSELNLIPEKDLKKLTDIINSDIDEHTDSPIEFNFIPKRSNEIRWGEARFSVIKVGDEIEEIFIIIRDITERKKMEKKLANRENELMTQNVLLEEKNIALRELLQQIETEKNKIASNIQTNVNKLILPLIEKLLEGSSEIQNMNLHLLKNNLLNLLSPFGHEISKKMLGLTQKEIEICNMIKSGHTSKDIARFMNVSYRTVETHRNNIRKKLKILNENINLQTYLRYIDEFPKS